MTVDNKLKHWLKQRYAMHDMDYKLFQETYEHAKSEEKGDHNIEPIHVLSKVSEMSAYFVSKELQDNYLRDFQNAYLLAEETHTPQIVEGEGPLYYIVRPGGVVSECMTVRSYDLMTESEKCFQELKDKNIAGEIDFPTFRKAVDKIKELEKPVEFLLEYPDMTEQKEVPKGVRGLIEYTCRARVGEQVCVWLDKHGFQWNPSVTDRGLEGWENSLMSVVCSEDGSIQETADELTRRLHILKANQLGDFSLIKSDKIT